MHTQRVFIYEHVSGGGFNNREIPLSLFSEGFGMLRTIIEDFKALDFEVKTMLDYRIMRMSILLNCDYIMEVKRGTTIIEEFKSLIKDCQYVFIIAPEFSKILYKFTKVAEDMGKTLFSMNSAPILLGSSKLQTYNFFKNSGVLTPMTFHIKNFDNKFSIEDARKFFHLLHSPAILKPEDSVGAESIYLIRNEQELEKIISKENQYLDDNRDYVLQEYINGTDLSASFIKQENRLIILSINSQKIKLIKNKINYLGGMTPADNSDHIKKEIIELTENLDLTKFKGYFGIDFIRMADGKIYLIEINPRLTTSYIGIRNISKANPILLLVYPDTDPDEIIDSSYKYCSEYYHMKLKYIGPDDSLDLWGDIFKSIPEIITPPLPLNLKSQENKIFTCFVSIRGRNLKQIQKRKRSIAHFLNKLNFELYSEC
jgi:tyramine---L-glutamate ligase